MAETKYIALPAISLFLSSIFISFFMLQIYGANVAAISFPFTSNNFAFQSQDFTTNAINESYIDKTNGATWTYYNGIGRVFTSYPVREQTGYLLFKNIQPDTEGYIRNTYYINNSVKQDYRIVLSYGGTYPLGFKVKSNSVALIVYMPYPLETTELYNIVDMPLSNANQYINVKIDTTFNKDLRTFSYTMTNTDNGNTLLYFDGELTSGYDLFGASHYGGVASDTLGFTFKKFETNNLIQASNSFSSLSMVQQTFALIEVIFTLVFWNVSEAYFPAILNLILIKSQCMLLGIALFVYVRS